MNQKQTKTKLISLFVGPLLALATGYILMSSGWDSAACCTGAIACLCAVWWIFEPIPIPATSIIPLASFPVLDIMSHQEVAAAYGHKLILLLLGGFVLSVAMEKSGAHRKIANGIIKIVGTDSKKKIILSFMLASAVLSMWISNTATTLMLLPIILAFLSKNDDRSMDLPVLLGIAYAASIGGIGTPIGTPPNIVFMSEYQASTGKEISFIGWMKIALPAVIIAIPIIWFWLTRKLKGGLNYTFETSEKWTSTQKRTLAIFALTALCWISRQEPFGGWSSWLNLPNAHDSSVALGAVILLFLVPNGEKPGEKLMDWQSAERIPWGMLILFSGGICIAGAFKQTGLSSALGSQISQLSSLHIFFVILIICLGVTFLTELTSNTASTILLMPILASASISAGLDPLTYMLPAVLSASCAFMLPIATLPNAIIYGSGKVKISDMAREGFLLNLIIASIFAIYCFAIL